MTEPKGMHYRDQVGYSAETVERYLPAIWDEEFVLTAGEPRTLTSTIPGWIIACADVSLAWRRANLSRVERECLRNVYHLGCTPGALASTWGVSAEDIHEACQAGILALTLWLNGRTPA